MLPELRGVNTTLEVTMTPWLVCAGKTKWKDEGNTAAFVQSLQRTGLLLSHGNSCSAGASLAATLSMLQHYWFFMSREYDCCIHDAVQKANWSCLQAASQRHGAGRHGHAHKLRGDPGPASVQQQLLNKLRVTSTQFQLFGVLKRIHDTQLV